MFQHSTRVLSRISSQLLLRTSKMGSWRQLPKNNSGFTMLGLISSTPSFLSYHQVCKKLPNKTKSKFWEPTESMLDEDTFQRQNAKFLPKPSRWHFSPSARRFNWMDNMIPWQMRKESVRKRLANYSKITNETIQQ